MPGYRASTLNLGDIFAFDRDDDDDAPNDVPILAASEPTMNDYTSANHAALSIAMLPPVTNGVNGTVVTPIDPGASPSESQDEMPPSTNGNMDAAEVDAEMVADDYESSEPSEPEERIRRDGESFVKGRTISADLDPTDSMIVNLKNANHPNEYIAEQLRKHGLVAYDSKTVGSRYIRLMRKIAEREAERLEDELTDWHEGEDEALIRADELAQNEINDVIQRAKARRWQIVAKNLHKILKKDLKYGPKACEKRFVELIDERASIPITMDDDPEGRRVERARRVLEKLNERNIRAAREKTRREEKAAAASEEKLRKEIIKTRRAEERYKNAAQKAAELKKRAMEQNSRHESEKAKRAKAEQRTIARSKALATAVGITYTPPPVADTSSRVSPAPNGTSYRSRSSTPAKRKRVTIADPETADSPRNRLSVKELGKVLALRGLHKSGSKVDLIKRLDASDQTMSAKDLKERLKAENMNTEGTRSELIARLVASDVAKSAWGKIHAAPSSVERSASAEYEPVAKRTKVNAEINDTDADDEDDLDGDEDDGAGKDNTEQLIREPTADSGFGASPGLE